MIGYQHESMIEEMDAALPIAEADYGSTEMVALDEAALDGVSGGARNAGSSTSGYSRNRMTAVRGNFAGPNGAGNFSAVQTEEIGSFAQDTWDIDQ